METLLTLKKSINNSSNGVAASPTTIIRKEQKQAIPVENSESGSVTSIEDEVSAYYTTYCTCLLLQDRRTIAWRTNSSITSRDIYNNR